MKPGIATSPVGIASLRIKLNDRVRIEDIHARCKLVSLEQRRRSQLLLLMYKKKCDVTMHKVFPRNTRFSRRIVFKTDSKEGALYKRSPYFVGAKLGTDIYTFKARLKRLNPVYLDLLKKV